MLLSGVVRNRKTVQVTTAARSRSRTSSFGAAEESLVLEGVENPSLTRRLLLCCIDNAIVQNISLRVHKFTFQWDLFLHLFIGSLSVLPFYFSGNRLHSILPILVWCVYNIIFIQASRYNLSIGTRDLDRRSYRRSFQSSMEDFFSKKVLYIFSVTFLLVVLSLSVSGHQLGGPPLCFSSCSTCLASWSKSIRHKDASPANFHNGCGYENGEELLSVYTMAQTSFLLFFSVVILMAMCMAWKVDQDDVEERKAAEDWLKKEDLMAFHLRESIMKKFGSPSSSIRPEGNATWVFFGLVTALSFILLNWHNWEKLPPSDSGSLLILLNLLIILFSTLILHIGFFGRVIALYKRNYKRVEFLTKLVEDLCEKKLDAWWNCRNFVLNEDLALDYDIGGLAVSATFLITVGVFCILAWKCIYDGTGAILEAPGSYCAYASLYLCTCLIHIFTLATTTFEEQQRHIMGLQKKSLILLRRGASQANLSPASDWEYSEALKESEERDNLLHRSEEGSAGLKNSTRTIERSSSLEVDELQHVYFNEEDKKDGANLMNSTLQAPMSSGGGTSGLSISNIITSVAHSASSSALFGSGATAQGSGHTSGFNEEKLALLCEEGEHDNDTQSASGTNLGSVDNSTLPRPTLSRTNSDSIRSPRSYGRKPQIQRLMSDSMAAVSNSALNTLNSPNGSSGLAKPTLSRNVSMRGTMEASRSALAEMISQIRDLDPYPCIFGIPVMPALFGYSKFYLFLLFAIAGCRVMLTVIREII